MKINNQNRMLERLIDRFDKRIYGGDITMDVRGKTTNDKRLIDANALLSYIDECSQESRFRVYYGYAKSFIDDAPTVDAVEVVRCKDCKYWQDNNDGYPHEECRWGNGETPDANDFCSYGERKEGDD